MDSSRPMPLTLVWVAGLGITLGAAAFVGARRWQHASSAIAKRLRSRESGPASPYSARELEGLPDPVVRYFRHTLRDGQPMITSARIEWAGEFNLGTPGRDNWRPFTAVQDFVPGAPGFVWNARIRMMPGVPIFVRDSLVDGRGDMKGAAFGLVRVVDAGGTDSLATAALQRYLGEAVWFPTALLPRQGVTWTPVDHHRARATIAAGPTTVSLEFRFDDEGHVVSMFTPERFYDDGRRPAVPRPWEARNLRFEGRHGIVVPAESTVEWHLPTGVFAYWRGRPQSITYRYGKGRPVTPPDAAEVNRHRGA